MTEEFALTDICELITVYSPKGKMVHVQNRATYGISFCEEGQITYYHKGKEYVSEPGVAIILPQGESYTLVGKKKGNFPVVNFTCTGFSCDRHMLIPINDREPFIKDFKRMQSLSLFPGNRLKIMGIFYQMLDKLFRQRERGTGVLSPAVSYLEKHFCDETLSNEMLAKQCGISEVYFRKLFTEQYGISPKQYIIDIRITRAKQLLSEGRLKISAVSEACGFSNPYHFCRMFKEKNGITPTEYMRENYICRI